MSYKYYYQAMLQLLSLLASRVYVFPAKDITELNGEIVVDIFDLFVCTAVKSMQPL